MTNSKAVDMIAGQAARILALEEALQRIANTAPSENGWSSDAHMNCCAIALAALNKDTPNAPR